MKKIFIAAVLLTLSSLCFSMQAKKELTIVNHFDETLYFKIGINPETLPDFNPTFSLNSGDQIKSQVLDIGKHSYIRVDASAKRSAFWGVDIENQQVTIHGYLSRGIAYSWNKQSIITFCLPEAYKANGGHC